MRRACSQRVQTGRISHVPNVNLFTLLGPSVGPRKVGRGVLCDAQALCPTDSVGVRRANRPRRDEAVTRGMTKLVRGTSTRRDGFSSRFDHVECEEERRFFVSFLSAYHSREKGGVCRDRDGRNLLLVTCSTTILHVRGELQCSKCEDVYQPEGCIFRKYVRLRLMQ